MIHPHVPKSYLRTNYSESNFEEDIDMNNQFRYKNLPDPIGIREPSSKVYVDYKFNDPSIIKNTAHNDFNDKNLDNVRFKKLYSYPAIGEHATGKFFVDQSTDEPKLVRKNKNKNFNNLSLSNIF